MPDPEKPDNAPPVTVILEKIKAVEEDSLIVKVKLAVSPDFKAVLFEVIVIVGAVVSTWIVN